MSEAEAKLVIGAFIRVLRKEQGWSQNTLAHRAGISYQYLSGIETGKENFSIQILQAVANALEIPVDVLVASAYDTEGQLPATKLALKDFRTDIPLPEGLTPRHLYVAANRMQLLMYHINTSLRSVTKRSLKALVHPHGVSEIASALFANALTINSPLRVAHMKNPYASVLEYEGTLLRSSVEVRMFFEGRTFSDSRNGRSGWYITGSFAFSDHDDVVVTRLMCAELAGHDSLSPDWEEKSAEVIARQARRPFQTNERGKAKLARGLIYSYHLQHDKKRPDTVSINAVPDIGTDTESMEQSEP